MTLLDDGCVHLLDDGSGIDDELLLTADAFTMIDSAPDGTTVTCLPERRANTSMTFTFAGTGRRLQQIAFLHHGVSVTMRDDRSTPEVDEFDEVVPDVHAERSMTVLPLHRRRTFRYDGGLVDFVRHINRTRNPIHPNVIRFGGTRDGVDVEIAMQWNAGYSPSVYSFVNTIPTPHGGPHDEGFHSAVLAAVSRHGHLSGVELPDLTADDTCEGLAAVVAISVPEPWPTMSESACYASIAAAVEYVCRKQLTQWFATHADEGDVIVDKVRWSYVAARTSRRSSCGYHQYDVTSSA